MTERDSLLERRAALGLTTLVVSFIAGLVILDVLVSIQLPIGNETQRIRSHRHLLCPSRIRDLRRLILILHPCQAPMVGMDACLCLAGCAFATAWQAIDPLPTERSFSMSQDRCCTPKTNLSRRAVLRGLMMSAVAPAWGVPARANTLFEPADIICSLKAYPDFRSTRTVMKAPPEAQKAVQLIVDAIGIEQNFEVLSGDFDRKVGGFATVRGKTRYIVYDADEFTFADGKTDWIGMGLMGHEIGHHVAAHTHIHAASSHDRELEADRFAGFVLARLGASKDQALAWTWRLSRLGSDSHPSRERRQAAVSAGWALAETAKIRERGFCKPDWLSDPISINGRSCRIARTCPNREAHIRLACQA